VAGATTSSTATGTATGGAATRPAPPFNGPAHGTAAHEDAEKAVTGDSAAKAQAAAVKSVGGGSAGAVTTDFTGSGFETTVTKTDGSKVEVHLNSAYEALPGPGARRGVPPAPGY
jgi:nicotinic acid phosphoribosyltransferase